MKKPNGYWTYERCKDAALTCNSTSELQNKYNTVYVKILKNKWNFLFDHMENIKSTKGYWTYDKCKDEALKYKYRSEFDKKCPSAYRKVLKNKWLELFDHFERIGNKRKRLIYVYEFTDNFFYVGLTCNMKRRNNQHFGIEKSKDSSVHKHILKTNTLPKLLIKTDYVDVYDAILLEEKILNEYKNNGWNTLNEVKTGGVGSNNIKWTADRCREESLRYDNISDFMMKSKSAYNSSMKYGLIDEFFIRKKSINNYWNNQELCREESKNYNTRSEFCQNNWSAYNHSSINGWLDEFFPKNKKRGE